MRQPSAVGLRKSMREGEWDASDVCVASTCTAQQLALETRPAESATRGPGVARRAAAARAPDGPRHSRSSVCAAPESLGARRRRHRRAGCADLIIKKCSSCASRVGGAEWGARVRLHLRFPIACDVVNPRAQNESWHGTARAVGDPPRPPAGWRVG